MHDMNWIRENPESFDEAMDRRGASFRVAPLLGMDTRRRALLTELQTLQSQKNQLAKDVGQWMGQLKKSHDDALPARVEAAKAESSQMQERMGQLEQEAKAAQEQLDSLLATIPNILEPSVPTGTDESGNQCIRTWGTPRQLGFAVRDHVEIGERLGQMDFTKAAQMSGTRFVVLKGALARLERALAAFMLDTHTSQYGYQEVVPPVLVRANALYGTGQLPKFEEDLFKTTTDHYLIPTAEVPLTNLVAGDILDDAKLPLRFTAHTPCFRSEAGSAGRDTRGMIRLHQFNKVELVSITTPETSAAEHERMLGVAEHILQALGLPYRVMLLCSGDTGFGSAKTYDLEVWLPAQDTYREISSCSNFGAFQARRMNTRTRPAGEKQTRFVHTLNGSALAVGRTLVAVLENYQQEDGSVVIPEVLRPYMGGMEKIV